MDTCGAYDGSDDIVANHKEDYAQENWTNALEFLEWFGVQKMGNFGIVIINDESEK